MDFLIRHQNQNSLNNLIIGDNGEKNMQAPVIWLTGLPASGKTTLTNELKKYYDQTSLPCDISDGDEIRKTLSKDLGFSPENKKEHNRRIIFVANLLAKNVVATIILLISPHRETRDNARKETPNLRSM